MPIFRCFYKIIWKNKVSLFVYMGIFIMLSVLLSGNASSNPVAVYNDTAIPVAVIDRDHSESSVALKAYISERQKMVELADESEIF